MAPALLVLATLLAGCSGESGVDVARSDAARLDTSAGDAQVAGDVTRNVAASLYGPLAEQADPNLVYSPTSISLALGMLRAGATGESADQLDALFGAADADQLAQGFNSLEQILGDRVGEYENSKGNPAEIQLSSANSIWAQDGTDWEAPFLDVLAANYGAGVQLVDFADGESAREAINGWVSDNTADKIPELIPADGLNANSKLVLTNALYAKAPWHNAFHEVGDADFTTVDGQVEQVPTMVVESSMAYQRGDGWQAVRVPYAGRELAMTLLVPDAGSLEAVEEQLDGEQLGMLLDAEDAEVNTTTVNLTMPLFDLRTPTILTETLEAIGVTAPFEPTTADFAPMSSDPDVIPLTVGEVRHEATITVDEEGTEAAAATSVEGELGAAPPDDWVDLTVDRPFIFVLHDVATATPLFVGRVGDPLVE